MQSNAIITDHLDELPVVRANMKDGTGEVSNF